MQRQIALGPMIAQEQAKRKESPHPAATAPADFTTMERQPIVWNVPVNAIPVTPEAVYNARG